MGGGSGRPRVPGITSRQLDRSPWAQVDKSTGSCAWRGRAGRSTSRLVPKSTSPPGLCQRALVEDAGAPEASNTSRGRLRHPHRDVAGSAAASDSWRSGPPGQDPAAEPAIHPDSEVPPVEQRGRGRVDAREAGAGSAGHGRRWSERSLTGGLRGRARAARTWPGRRALKTVCPPSARTSRTTKLVMVRDSPPASRKRRAPRKPGALAKALLETYLPRRSSLNRIESSPLASKSSRR